MAFVFGCLLVLIILFSKAVMGTIKTPVFAYSIIWCIVGFGANIALYDYYKPSTLVNYIIIFGIVIFFVIYCLGLTGVSKSFFIDNIELTSFHINMKIFIACNFLGIILMIPSLKTALGLLSQNGLWYIRANASEVYTGGVMAILADSIIRPLFVATTVLAVVYSFSDGSRKVKAFLLVLATIENILLVFSTAGRAPIVNYLFYFIIAMILFKGNSIFELIRHEKKKIIFLVVLVVGVVILTQMRSTSDINSDDVIETFYSYYFSGPSYLTQLLDNVKTYGIEGERFWGAATFGFLSNIYSFVMIFLTGRSQGTLYIIGSVITNKQYWVGEHTLLNAMCTGFYPFVLDWGYAGIVIGPMILGIFTTIITKRTYRNANLFNVAIYVYWIYVLIRTVFKWDLVNIDFSVVLIALYVFTRDRYEAETGKCRV